MHLGARWCTFGFQFLDHLNDYQLLKYSSPPKKKHSLRVTGNVSTDFVKYRLYFFVVFLLRQITLLICPQ